MKKAMALGCSCAEAGHLSEQLASLHLQCGENHYLQKQYKAALEEFSKAAEIQPDHRIHTLKQISCLLFLERFDECLSLLEKELQRATPTPDLLVTRAQLNLMFGNATKCYHDVENALELQPDHSMALKLREELVQKTVQAKNQAVKYCLIHKQMEALRKISSAIQSDPHAPEHYLFRGILHRQLGCHNEAVDDLLVAMHKCGHQHSAPVYRDACQQLVITYNDFAVECFRKGFYEEAVVLLNKAIKEEKNESSLYINRGDAFCRKGELPFALLDYQQARDMSGARWDICYRLAMVHHTLGRQAFSEREFSSAEGHFTQAIEHSPHTSNFYYCRAQSKYARKDKLGAKRDTIRALLLEPTSEECLPLLARLFPGESVNHVINSQEAQELWMSLRDAHIREGLTPSSDEKRSHSLDDKASLYVARLLEDMELRIEDQESESADRVSHMEKPPSTSPVQHGKNTPSLTGHKDCSQMPRSPTIPFPAPPTSSRSDANTIPNLRHCLQENEFHSLIYYSKKACCDEVKAVLHRSTVYQPPPTLLPLSQQPKSWKAASCSIK